MKEQLTEILEHIISQLGQTKVSINVEKTANPAFGEYTTAAPLQLAKALKKKPLDIATEIVDRVKGKGRRGKLNEPSHSTNQKDHAISKNEPIFDVLQDIERIEVVAPGFINFYITSRALIKNTARILEEKEGYGKKAIRDKQKAKSKKVMVEFAHPNTHKAFHIGHLRNITTGEAIVRLLESQGIQVVRANYQGDVGMHIAKCLYGILQRGKGKGERGKFDWTDLKTIEEKINFLGKAYAAGSKAFEEDKHAKTEIAKINKQIYAKDPSVWEIYQTTRQWSLDYFESIYTRVGTHFDRYYFESETYESGKNYVLEGLKKGIFVQSDKAVIFPGEKYGLHNRVFITSEGNATYEAKDIGLAQLQFKEYNPDRIIHVVGPEQAGYFQVVFKAAEQMFPHTKEKEQHFIYGWVKLKHGKMSSRSGNVVLGEWLLDEAKKFVNDILQQSASKYSDVDQEMIAEKAAIAAVKYSFLRVSPKQEIAFDIHESVNMHGDSGPYLQYTYARCQSVLRKASETDVRFQVDANINPEERAVLVSLWQFPEVVASAAAELSPNTLCTYLYILAGEFNTFYNKYSILDAETILQKQFRLELTAATAQVLKNGLYLLGIEVLEQM